jgi:peptide deformylase
MILPIYAYGHQVLKKPGLEVSVDDPQLPQLLEDMWETMYNAKGIGLAAPQVGRSMRIFLIDTAQIEREDDDPEVGVKEAFINPTIIEETGEYWAYEEGCLSIPKLTGDVERQESVTIEYVDANFDKKLETFTGMNARVIQHEYDHIEGILFTERLKPLKRRMINRKLENIKKGKIIAPYKMKFKKQ